MIIRMFNHSFNDNVLFIILSMLRKRFCLTFVPFERRIPRACNFTNFFQVSREIFNALIMTMSSAGSSDELTRLFYLIHWVTMLLCDLNILDKSVLIVPAVMSYFNISLSTMGFSRTPVDLFPMKYFHVSVTCFELSNFS